MTVALRFCGAAGTVTGSCYLLEHPLGRVLIDCGMFQGPKTLRTLNYGPLPFDVARIDAVLVTHAHLDHTGLLPKLRKQGYDGPIIATAPTADLLRWLLPDSGAIQELEVERLNRRNEQRGRQTVTPIYGRADGEACAKSLRAAPMDRWVEAAEGVRARFWNAGHILGSASIELEVMTGNTEKRLLRFLFSGDLGPGHKSFHADPASPENIDYLVVEATYGDRDRTTVSEADRQASLAAEVTAAVKAGGNLLIPAFAVERTQELLFDLAALMQKQAIPTLQIFLDSPLAIRATEVFEHHLGATLRGPNVRFTESVEDSIALGRVTAGAIIIAGSGMCDAGRIRGHLVNNLWRPEATVLLVGYQAPGTLGNLLATGAKSVRIHGSEVVVRARIRQTDAYSGHAGRDDLLAWVKDRLPVVGGVFVTHGEEGALAALSQAVTELGVPASRVFVPQLDQTYLLDRLGQPARIAAEPPPRLAAYAMKEVAAGRDWHNEYAAFVLDLQHHLNALGDDALRARLLQRARRLLG